MNLTVLGVISFITLPTIFINVESPRQIAVFKEDINILQNLAVTCDAEGMLIMAPEGWHACMLNKLQIVRGYYAMAFWEPNQTLRRQPGKILLQPSWGLSSQQIADTTALWQKIYK